MHWFFTLLISLLVIFLIILAKYSYNVVNIKKLYAHIPQADPERKENFFFGLANEELTKPDQSEVFTRWCLRQESPICQTRILDLVFVWNSDLQYIKEVTGKEGIDNYKEGHHFRRADYASLAKVFGHSIVDAKGESWRWRKKLLLPYFQNNYLASLIPVIQHKFEVLSEYVHSLDGKEMDIDAFFTEITIEIISHHIWGREIALSSKDLMVHFQNFVLENRNLDSAAANVGLNILLKLQKAVGADKVHSNYIASRNELIRILTKEVQISKELMNESIVTEMIKSESYRTDLELISEILMLLFAGHDTTAHTMSFLMYLMCHNPDKLEALRKENDEIFEKKGSEPWTPELLGSMPYLTAAMQETLRFYPIAWASSVVAMKDTEVGGFVIPKGTELIHNFRAAGLNPKYFKQPESFLPERFLKGSELNNEGSYVFQFNLGPHICLGRNLAYIETRLIISELLRHFDFKIAPDFNLELAILLTLRPLNGVKMILTPRTA